MIKNDGLLPEVLLKNLPENAILFIDNKGNGNDSIRSYEIRVEFAFAATTLLGISGDATVPPTSGIISRKFGAEKMAVLYGFTLIGHQIGAFASSNLGGILVKMGRGYAPLWVMNMILAMIAAIASFAIQNDRTVDTAQE